MNKELLMKFCGSRDDDRFNKPMNDENHTYVCNGHILIKVNKLEEFNDNQAWISEKANKYISESKKDNFMKFENLPVPEFEICSTCRGDKFCIDCDDEQDDCAHGESIVFKKGEVFLEAIYEG